MARWYKFSARPYRVTYTFGTRKVGRVAACGTPEGVVRSAAVRVFQGEADTARVEFLGEPVCYIVRDDKGSVSIEYEEDFRPQRKRA